MAEYFKTSIDGDEFEPFPADEADVIVGPQNGEVRWLRHDPSGDPAAGIFRCDSSVTSYFWAQDESIHVLEGSVEIVFEDGEKVHLQAGDVGSFCRGQRADWHITGPFREFFVLSGKSS
jgi:uncharacterized protein